MAGRKRRGRTLSSDTTPASPAFIPRRPGDWQRRPRPSSAGRARSPAHPARPRPRLRSSRAGPAPAALAPPLPSLRPGVAGPAPAAGSALSPSSCQSCGRGAPCARRPGVPARLTRPAGHGAPSSGSRAAGGSQPARAVSARLGAGAVETGRGAEILLSLPRPLPAPRAVRWRVGGSRRAWLLGPSDPDSMGDLEPGVPRLCLSFLICTMGFGVGGSVRRTGSALPGLWGLRFSEDICLDPGQYPPLPQFPWEVSSAAWDPALSFWVLTGAWLPPLPSPGDSSPPAAERRPQHEGSGKWGKESARGLGGGPGPAASVASHTPGLTHSVPLSWGKGRLAAGLCGPSRRRSLSGFSAWPLSPVTWRQQYYLL